MDLRELELHDPSGKLRIDDNPLTQLRSVFDDNGIARALMGNLPSNGASPAQWGFRATDASNVPIFDSLGLIAVMKRIASNSFGSSTLNITTTSGMEVPNTDTTYTLSRQQTVLVMGNISCLYGSANNAHYALCGLEPQTANSPGSGVPSPYAFVNWSNTGVNPVLYTPIMLWQVRTLAAGSYHAGFQVQSANTGDQLLTNNGQIDVFLIGG